jgi:ABC-type branched-subunit amino acid transport system substrate-binding protein
VRRLQDLKRPGAALLVLAVTATLSVGCGSSSSDANGAAPTGAASTTGTSSASVNDGLVKASGTVRGFDGTTLTVAGMGLKASLGGAEWGARGRLKRFNDTNEIPGIKINFTEFADDKGDPALSLSEGRRLVTSEKVFALVGDVSATNPAAYFVQQKVPYLGAALDKSFCSDTPSTELWGFSNTGCQTPENPSLVSDTGRPLFEYTTKKLGVAKPTIAIFSNDTESGKLAAKFAAPAYAGAGFDVVSSNILLAQDPISDYTPYVQQLLKANGGKAPDAIECLLTTDCIPIWAQLKASGYKGVYEHFLYSDLLTKPMQGTVVETQTVPFGDNTPALKQMTTDIKAVKADAQIEAGAEVGYLNADIFITAVKKLVAKGKDYVTPENLQKVLSTITWKADGLGGPITYPASTVNPTPSCNALLEDKDGTSWTTVYPYTCSSKSYPVT